jgi:hypothetical protein
MSPTLATDALAVAVDHHLRFGDCPMKWLRGCLVVPSHCSLDSNVPDRHAIEGAGAGGDGSGGGSGEGGNAVVISQDVLTGPVHVAITVLAGKNTYSTQVSVLLQNCCSTHAHCSLPHCPLACLSAALGKCCACLSACTSSRLRCRTRIEEPARACFPSACTRVCPCCCGRVARIEEEAKITFL